MDAYIIAKGDAFGPWGVVISTLGTVIVAVLAYLGARSTTGHGGSKSVEAGDYKLKKIDLAAQVGWTSVTDEAWARQQKWLKRTKPVAPIILVISFIALQWSFTTSGFPLPLLAALFVVVGLAEYGLILVNRAIVDTADKTAAEAGTFELQIVVEGEREAVLSRCIMGVRKIGHAIASVDVQPSVAEIVSIGDYGNEWLRVSVTEGSPGEYRLKIAAERRPSFSSPSKTRKCVFRLVEQLTGYRLYASPSQKRQTTVDLTGAEPEEGADEPDKRAAATPSIASG
jgi:hypothetical protein